MVGLSITNIRKTLFNWADITSGGLVPSENIFFREQSAPAPPRPSIGIKIIGGPSRTSSFDDLIPRCDSNGNPIDGEFLISGQRTLLVSINTYGENRDFLRPTAFDTAIHLHSSLVAPSSLDILRMGGVAVHRIEDINNLSAIEESEYEDRYNFDFMIGVAQNFKQKISTIETVSEIGLEVKAS